MVVVPDWLLSYQIALPTVAVVVVVGRLYYGSVIFAPRFLPVWAVARRILTPLSQRLLMRVVPIPVSLESSIPKREYVGVVDLSPQELATRVDGERDVEIPLLASLSSDWDGNLESGTFVWYCGSKPAWLPRWLRPYQVHITLFRIGSATRVTAHFEGNSYRPDYWIDHLTQGASYNAAKGVQRCKRALQDSGVSLTNESPEAV